MTDPQLGTPRPGTPRAADGEPPVGGAEHPEGLEFERHCLDAAPGALYDYRAGWERQHRVLDEVCHHRAPDRVILCQHESVYTAGRQTRDEDRPLDGTPVIDVDRGGDITWHGPGQLVGYPIVLLPREVGIVDHVRRLEEVVIRLLADYGLATGRVPGRTGVWLASDGRRPERKICAIGVRCAHRTTMHGFALNVAPDLGRFDAIVPCGIADADVTSIHRELGSAPSLERVADDLEPLLRELLAMRPYRMSPDIPRNAHPRFRRPRADRTSARTPEGVRS